MTQNKIISLTATQFRRKLRAIGMTQRGFAQWVQMDVVSVNRWATGKVAVPYWVRLLIDLKAELQKR